MNVDFRTEFSITATYTADLYLADDTFTITTSLNLLIKKSESENTTAHTDFIGLSKKRQPYLLGYIFKGKENQYNVFIFYL